MEPILEKLGLGKNVVELCIQEKITPDIVCKLTAYEMQCLGVNNRSDMMALRIECVAYGNSNHNEKCHGEFEIPKLMLEFLLDADFKISDISKMLSVSESTVYRRMRQYGLSKVTYSDIDINTVEIAVREIVLEFPRCGERMIHQLLRKKQIKIPRSELRDCLHQVDMSGVHERSRRRIHRRVYEVVGPNHLWHVDTNHKLIRWHFIIVGGIDGFSRLVTFLKCTNNNKADTVLKCFQEGVQEFGVPLRVRSDMGMENVAVADFMIQARGSNSMLTGKSTHNQRIERLWRDVYEGVLCFYYTLFHFIEDEGDLNILDDIHITALHYVYLPKINEKLQIWQQAWAGHRIRTVKSSPMRLFTAGLLNSPIEKPLDMPQVATSEMESPLDEEGNHRPIFSSPLVHVNENCESELHLEIPRHWESSNFGIDVFHKAVAIMKRHI